ncbi:hypothetical protein [Brachyspira hyodysenteriae]|uniref:hypothetical protein n=1 Tax=Brachyspira hyodysenteriae TaxID=159 RepID=UPI0022CD2AE2|nr:hypothetical protein [Brachyspira hyodysenteriae]MCZ9920435.1 hypothetical protein [Brachyspira hyodysenteriae]MDA0024038.1 hypothetical protein [Brachyspira hyodysenteriae]
MREVNFIENKGRFGITFMSDDIAEANTVMNAIQRFILKNTKKETGENIDFSICPIGEYKGTIWLLINTISLKKYLSDYNLPEGYKNKLIEELKKRGEYIDDSNIEELKKQIKDISKDEQYPLLSDEDLEKISLLESEIKNIDNNYNETAKHILQGRKFNRSRELENKITQGRRISELTLEELEELKEVTILDHYKEDIQKEIDKRKNKSFEEILKENNEIMSFGEDEDDSNYRIDEDNEEDPLSSDVDEDNINRWDFDADGDKVDSEGNKMLFADEE